MDLEGIMTSETRHTEKDKCHIVLFMCGISEIILKNTGNKTETNKTQRTNWCLPEEEGVGRCVKQGRD